MSQEELSVPQSTLNAPWELFVPQRTLFMLILEFGSWLKRTRKV